MIGCKISFLKMTYISTYQSEKKKPGKFVEAFSDFYLAFSKIYRRPEWEFSGTVVKNTYIT